MSSMEVNVDMLEQMDLMDMSDHEALDVFLHSGGEDNSAASPVTGGYPVSPPPAPYQVCVGVGLSVRQPLVLQVQM